MTPEIQTEILWVVLALDFAALVAFAAIMAVYEIQTWRGR